MRASIPCLYTHCSHAFGLKIPWKCAKRWAFFLEQIYPHQLIHEWVGVALKIQVNTKAQAFERQFWLRGWKCWVLRAWICPGLNLSSVFHSLFSYMICFTFLSCPIFKEEIRQATISAGWETEWIPAQNVHTGARDWVDGWATSPY